jgi:hypothetical protein
MPLMTIPTLLKLCETLLILFYSSSSLLIISSFMEEKEGASFEAFKLWGLVAFTGDPAFP